MPRHAKILALAVVLSLAAPFAARATDIDLPGDHAFPESITSTSDGTLYVSSPGAGGVLRIKPGGKPETFVPPGAYETRSTFGVLADERTHVLWVCSNDVSALGAPGPSTIKGSYIKAFDLKSGAGTVSVQLPGPHEFCNDIALMPDGGILVTDSFAPHILRLAPGGAKLDVWAENPMFRPPPKGAGLDGIVIGGDGNVYVDLFSNAKLFRVDMAAGKAGKVTALNASREMKLTDAMRDADGASFLMVEGSGKLDRVTIKGDDADLETLKDGMDGPTGVTKVGGLAYVTEGQLAKLFGRPSEKPQLPFKIREVQVR